MTDSPPTVAPTSTTGRTLHAPIAYDLLAWVYLRGRERKFRERLLRLAELRPGEAVLDIGCGTGTLAIAAREAVGATGRVAGLDASPEMLGRATRKARRAGAAVDFRNAAVERMPFPDASFDVVLSTLMMHHLPRPIREQGAREVFRVLRPGGRVFVVDFGRADRPRRGVLAHLHRHGHVDPEEIAGGLTAAGLTVTRRGAVEPKSLWFIVATRGISA